MRTGGRPCGPHAELAKTTGFRITQCPCGAVHMHVARSGVTLQLEPDCLAELVNVSTAAHRKLDLGGDDADGALPPGPMN